MYSIVTERDDVRESGSGNQSSHGSYTQAQNSVERRACSNEQKQAIRAPRRVSCSVPTCETYTGLCTSRKQYDTAQRGVQPFPREVFVLQWQIECRRSMRISKVPKGYCTGRPCDHRHCQYGSSYPFSHT